MEKSKTSNNHLLKFFDINSTFDDKLWKDETFKSLSDNVIKNNLIPAFKSEDRFIEKWRGRFAWGISVIIILQMIALFTGGVFLGVADVFNEDYDINIPLLSIFATTVFANTIGLMLILFKYVFNRTDNKVLDILDSFLKTRAAHELSNNNDDG